MVCDLTVQMHPVLYTVQYVHIVFVKLLYFRVAGKGWPTGRGPYLKFSLRTLHNN